VAAAAPPSPDLDGVGQPGLTRVGDEGQVRCTARRFGLNMPGRAARQ
jgi:hypothetical protein